MKPASFDYEQPRDLAAAVRLLAGSENAKVLAGGQSLGPMLNLRVVYPGLLVDVSRLPELREVEDRPEALTLGAGITHAEIEDGDVPDATRGMMRHVAGNIAYRAVRNRGTIGGSLVHADPAADWVTAMTALGARLLLADRDGTREAELPGFMTGPLATTIGDGEVVRAVRIPKLSSRARWGYYKLCRKTGEFAHAIGAVVVDPATNTRRAVVGAIADAPVLFIGDEVESLVAAEGDRSIEAATRLIAARRIGRDDISGQVFAVTLARAAAMARTMR